MGRVMLGLTCLLLLFARASAGAPPERWIYSMVADSTEATAVCDTIPGFTSGYHYVITGFEIVSDQPIYYKIWRQGSTSDTLSFRLEAFDEEFWPSPEMGWLVPIDSLRIWKAGPAGAMVRRKLFSRGVQVR